MSSLEVAVDREVFQRYVGLSLPRHVSYPMPTWWSAFDSRDAKRLIDRRTERTTFHDLSLYIHIPYCQALCKFCACSRVIQRKEGRGAAERTQAYVDALVREIRSAGRSNNAAQVRQIHYGGGTPTYLSIEQLRAIHDAINDTFDIASDAEVAMEIDPRVTSDEQLDLLADRGFNRLSLGVQDFDRTVQEHVHRVQPYEQVKQIVDACRVRGIASINFDLIYGLPYQTMDTVSDTLARVIELSPDRVAYYHYAQIPDTIATQVAIHHHAMPDSDVKLDMFTKGVRVFTEAGYRFIGLDHFARDHEGLAKAEDDGGLHRNFQGMTTGAALDLVAFGASAISEWHDLGYLQNVRDPVAYVSAINANGTAVHRGMALSDDDRIRKAVIHQIYCHARIVPAHIESQFDISFGAYFERELDQLNDLASDGIVIPEADGSFSIPYPLGRVLMRNVGAIFDAYLPDEAYRVGCRSTYSTNA